MRLPSGISAALCAALSAAVLAACGGSAAHHPAGPGPLRDSSPIGGAAERAVLARAFAFVKPRPPEAAVRRLVDCIIAGAEARGITTHGQFDRAGSAVVATIAVACHRRVLGGQASGPRG